jgi:hypothetical protein
MFILLRVPQRPRATVYACLHLMVCEVKIHYAKFGRSAFGRFQPVQHASPGKAFGVFQGDLPLGLGHHLRLSELHTADIRTTCSGL